MNKFDQDDTESDMHISIIIFFPQDVVFKVLWWPTLWATSTGTYFLINDIQSMIFNQWYNYSFQKKDTTFENIWPDVDGWGDRLTTTLFRIMRETLEMTLGIQIRVPRYNPLWISLKSGRCPLNLVPITLSYPEQVVPSAVTSCNLSQLSQVSPQFPTRSE